METMTKNKFELLAEKLEQDSQKVHGDYYKTRVVTGNKYTKIDVGPYGQWSGRYMVDNTTGEIYGIKAYGVIHRGHSYGTLDTINNWFWGDYRARKI